MEIKNNMFSKEEILKKKKDKLFSSCKIMFCWECPLREISTFGFIPYDCKIDLRICGDYNLTEDEINEFYNYLDKNNWNKNF